MLWHCEFNLPLNYFSFLQPLFILSQHLHLQLNFGNAEPLSLSLTGVYLDAPHRKIHYVAITCFKVGKRWGFKCFLRFRVIINTPSVFVATNYNWVQFHLLQFLTSGSVAGKLQPTVMPRCRKHFISGKFRKIPHFSSTMINQFRSFLSEEVNINVYSKIKSAQVFSFNFKSY